MKVLNTIRQIFKDFQAFDADPDSYSRLENISTGNYNPPAYIVQMLLLGILGLENYGRMDKVLWHTFFRYKNQIFVIRDYKGGTWTIRGQQNEESLRLANEIKDKIVRVSRLLDKVLSSELKSEIDKGNYYLNNSYQKLYSIYDFYQKKLLSAIKSSERLDNILYDAKKAESTEKLIRKTKGMKVYLNKELTNVLNKRFRSYQMITNYSFALMLSYFSLLEFLLDVMYVFEQPTKFNEFRKREWRDRFKQVFSINTNKELKGIYDNLSKIKNEYRNPLTHGLLDDTSLLVHLPYAGLVPLSYEYMSGKIHYQFVEIRKEDALMIIDTFGNFLNYLREHEPYKFYLLYLNYMFPIPVNEKDILDLKKEMTTFKDFEEYLEQRALYEDMIANRDVF